MSITDLTEVINDLKIVESFEKETDKCQLVTSEELVPLLNYYRDKRFVCQDKRRTFHYYKNYHHSQYSTSLEFGDYFRKHHECLHRTLCRWEGKLSVCGLSISNIMNDRCKDTNFGLYIHSCTVEEAQNILLEVVKELKGEISYHLEDNTIRILSGDVTYCLSCYIYKDKQEILRNIGNSPKQNGWNPIKGYFGTIFGALSLVLSVATIDENYTFDEMQEYYENGMILLSDGIHMNPPVILSCLTNLNESRIYDYKGAFLRRTWKLAKDTIEEDVKQKNVKDGSYLLLTAENIGVIRLSPFNKTLSTEVTNKISRLQVFAAKERLLK